MEEGWLSFEADFVTVRLKECEQKGEAATGACPVSLLGLLAKIKCSICSYQFNI